MVVFDGRRDLRARIDVLDPWMLERLGGRWWWVVRRWWVEGMLTTWEVVIGRSSAW